MSSLGFRSTNSSRSKRYEVIEWQIMTESLTKHWKREFCLQFKSINYDSCKTVMIKQWVSPMFYKNNNIDSLMQKLKMCWAMPKLNKTNTKCKMIPGIPTLCSFTLQKAAHYSNSQMFALFIIIVDNQVFYMISICHAGKLTAVQIHLFLQLALITDSAWFNSWHSTECILVSHFDIFSKQKNEKSVSRDILGVHTNF